MDAIEIRLKTIPGLNTSAYVADQINPPQAIIAVPDIPTYHQTMQRGFFELDFEIYVLTSATLDREGQRALAAYVDPASSTSISQAIEGDRTLGGTVSDCIIAEFRGLRKHEVGALGFYGGIFTLHVFAQGS